MERKKQVVSDRGLLLRQVVKYGAVGVVNTLVTALVIYVALQMCGASAVVSNVLGYVTGLVTSFLLNSRWTFQTTYSWRRLGLFLLSFAICYGLQLLALLFLEQRELFSPYFRQLVAMGVYVVVNFILNKWVTFRPAKEEPQSDDKQ